MPVVDASVVVELLADGVHADAAAERLHRQDHALWAPELLDAEVGHALRRAVRHGHLDADRGGEALWELDDLSLRRVSHELLVYTAWGLRDTVSFYDGLYVALAAMLDEPLVTCDARLGRAGTPAKVEVIG